MNVQTSVLIREMQALDRAMQEQIRKLPRNHALWGKTRKWVATHLPARPMKMRDFIRKGAAQGGFHESSVYQMVVRMIDEGSIAENRFRREIWRPKD
jgi:hypothetical protein